MEKFINTIKEMGRYFIANIKKVLSSSLVQFTIAINVVVSAIVGPTIIAGALTGIVNMLVLVVVVVLVDTIFVAIDNARLAKKTQTV